MHGNLWYDRAREPRKRGDQMHFKESEGERATQKRRLRPSVKIIAEGKQIICDATIGDVTSFGGNTLDVNAFGCTIRFNGKPTITDAT